MWPQAWPGVPRASQGPPPEFLSMAIHGDQAGGNIGSTTRGGAGAAFRGGSNIGASSS